MQSLQNDARFCPSRRRAARQMAATALALAALSLPAWAADPAGSLPPVRDSAGTAYVTGGVSADQSQAFKSAQRQWPLAISLLQRSAHTNEYTASATVKIVDAQGRTVLDAPADGPFMLVRLPPGTYRVSAGLNGHVLKRERVRVGDAQPAKVDFVFPADAS